MTSMPLTLRTMFFELMVLNPFASTARNACGEVVIAGLTRNPCRHEAMSLLARHGSRVKSGMTDTSGLAVVRRACSQLLVGCVFRRGGPDQGLDDLLIALQPVGSELPLLAVPGVDASPGSAHVVRARCADGAHHAGKAQC